MSILLIKVKRKQDDQVITTTSASEFSLDTTLRELMAQFDLTRHSIEFYAQ